MPTQPRIFELIFSADNQYALVCFGISQRYDQIDRRGHPLNCLFQSYSKSSSHTLKFAAVNFETERIENYPDRKIFCYKECL